MADLNRIIMRALHATRLIPATLTWLGIVSGAFGSPEIAVTPKLERAPDAAFQLQGLIEQRLQAVTAKWLLKVPEANPAVLQMFAERDRTPPRDLLPWSGEFAGKYLTGAVQVLRLTGNPTLKEQIASFAKQLVQLQADDGYLGPFPPDNHLLGKNGTWDAWGHYHIMLGLLLWHQESGDEAALGAALKIGDLLCRTFLKTDRRLVETGNAEMNHAPIHSLCLLYRLTGETRYLDLARQIAREFEDPRAGDYIRLANSGREFFQGPKPRWESLHPIQGIAELYWITGDDTYRSAFERLWWSIAKLDRHNNGGFSSGEQAQGNPYHPGAIETCCTVAWIAMSVDMLRMTGDSVVADELELSTLNQVLGYQHPSGETCSYNTPMDGIRRPSTEEIGFQIRPGSEQVNCCSANAPRGFGMISDWALMTDGQGLIVNWYGAGTMSSRVNGTRVTVKQETEYPRAGTITMRISPEQTARFPLSVRIPHWSASSSVSVNGESVSEVKPGTYVRVDREWKPGDTVSITLDMSLRYWAGERECAAKSSIYRGPLLLVLETPQQKPTAIRFDPSWKRFGELHAIDEPGASLECTFEGTAVVWEGRRFDDAGHARVIIDGKEVAIVDQYGPGRDLPFTHLFKDLPPGVHTLKLTVLADRNPGSKGRWVNVTRIGPPASPLPLLDPSALQPELVESPTDEAQVVISVRAKDGSRVQLRDYGTGGQNRTPYVSWLPVEGIKPLPFSRENPLRTGRFVAN
jgi:DUF1680 family protein